MTYFVFTVCKAKVCAMAKICETYGDDYDIKCNTKKNAILIYVDVIC